MTNLPRDLPRTPPAAEAPARSRAVPRRALWLVGGAVPLVLGAIAIPRLLTGGEDAPPPVAALTQAPTAAAGAPAPSAEAESADAGGPPAPAGPPIPVSADGDLVLRVNFRWPTFPEGGAIPATVRFGNAGTSAFHLPAPAEPHPSLALVVLDASGREVRRIVETSSDPYPRRTQELRSGHAMDLPVRILDAEDEPLPPGEYTVYAEFRPDPAWVRLGLPFWSAPDGPVRSDQESFLVVPRTE